MTFFDRESQGNDSPLDIDALVGRDTEGVEAEGSAPLNPAEFPDTQTESGRDKETDARARAIAEGLSSLQKVEDPDLRNKISGEFDHQLRGFVHHIMMGLVEQDESGALRRALGMAEGALGAAPEDLPFMNDLVRIARDHFEEATADGELDTEDVASMKSTLGAILQTQLDKLAEAGEEKRPPANDTSSDGEAPSVAA